MTNIQTHKVEVIQQVLKGIITRKAAAAILGCSLRSIRRYMSQLVAGGPEALVDHRHSNFYRLNPSQIVQIRHLKQIGSWRSARWIRDHLNLSVHQQTVWRVLGNLNRLNSEQIKPLQRFEAHHSNDLWQTDIMGKLFFPRIGCYLYLIATLDDHSRFGLSGKWYHKQSKINVFSCWYQALARWGLPKAMLQDKGSQYRPTGKVGEAEYQYYARLLNIKLIFAHKAQTKGKIERFWRFVQQDFARENLDCPTIEELNRKWQEWLFWYNYCFLKKHLGNRTASECYTPSRKRSDLPLKELLIVEVRRKVARESTISLFGHIYRVPRGYINCRIWIKIIGNKVLFEAHNKVFWKQPLKV